MFATGAVNPLLMVGIRAGKEAKSEWDGTNLCYWFEFELECSSKWNIWDKGTPHFWNAN